MWGETSQWPTILSDLALVLVVYIALKILWYDGHRLNCGGNLHEGTLCIVWCCCVVLCHSFVTVDCDMLLLLLLLLLLLPFAWTVKTTDNPHVCGPLNWGYGLGRAAR